MASDHITPTQQWNREHPYAGWCPACGAQMAWLRTQRVQWNICEACSVAFCPGSVIGDPDPDWQERLSVLSRCRDLSEAEYFGPGWEIERDPPTRA